MRTAFTVIFAASGAAALIYEVTWTRLLTLQIGHGLAAASTVLAAFMGGLAIGSAAGGRYSASLEPRRALRLYGILELAIGVLALALPFELAALSPLLASAYADGAGGATFAALRIASSLLLLSIPAAAMGATFPAASRWFIHSAQAAARDAGVMYAANTIGAAAGALGAGFVLLPALGLTGATWVGVLIEPGRGRWSVAYRRPSMTRRSLGSEGRASARAVQSRRCPGRSGGPRRSPQSRSRAHCDATAAPRTARPGLAAAALGRLRLRVADAAGGLDAAPGLMLGPDHLRLQHDGRGFRRRPRDRCRASAPALPPDAIATVGLAVCLALSVGFGAAAAALSMQGAGDCRRDRRSPRCRSSRSCPAGAARRALWRR